MRMLNPEIQLREDSRCTALLYKSKPVSLELLTRIENDKVVGLKEPSNIVDANRDLALGGDYLR